MAAHQAPRPWDSPGKNIGVRCHFLLQCLKVKSESEVSHVRLLATAWTAAYQAPPSTGFSRQEYWSGLPLPSPYKHARETVLGHRITDGKHTSLNRLNDHIHECVFDKAGSV